MQYETPEEMTERERGILQQKMKNKYEVILPVVKCKIKKIPVLKKGYVRFFKLNNTIVSIKTLIFTHYDLFRANSDSNQPMSDKLTVYLI